MLKDFLQGRFMNHPLHPMTVHLPIGLWVASVVFDLAFFASGTTAFATASYYCIGLGLVITLVSVPTGLAEYVDIPAQSLPKAIATTHLILNGVTAVLFLVTFIMRRRMEGGPSMGVTWGQFIVSLVATSTLAYSGYLGGRLVYEFGLGHRARRREALTQQKSKPTRVA